MSLHEIFQDNVQSELDRLGIDRAELSRRMRVTRTRISQVLNGQRVARLDLVERVADALETPAWKLLKPK